MAKRGKRKYSELTMEFFKENDMFNDRNSYLGVISTGDAESWKKNYIIRRNNDDLPKAWIGFIHSLDDDIISNGFQGYIYQYLKENHGLSFCIRDCEPGGHFVREPFMYIERNFVIITQVGGMDI